MGNLTERFQAFFTSVIKLLIKLWKDEEKKGIVKWKD